jgi:hypothetical protein
LGERSLDIVVLRFIILRYVFKRNDNSIDMPAVIILADECVDVYLIFQHEHITRCRNFKVGEGK